MVFEAEKQVAKNAVYHKKCFTCIKCKHQMDASGFINGPDDVYCIHCYKVCLNSLNSWYTYCSF